VRLCHVPMREKRPVSLGPLNPPELKPPDTSELASQFATDLQYYLVQQPRQLPSKYLYDELGSALFEAICRLPWYSITRAEERLLASHSGEIFRRLEPLSRIVELGSGSGDKLRLLIEGAGAHRSALDVHLVDVSPSALDASARTLRTLSEVTIAIHEAPYEVGLGEA